MSTRTAVAATAALLFGVPSAHAACAPTLATPVFLGLGDLANYTLAPGGNFESGTSGWSLTGSSVVAGNSTVALATTGGTHSLAITPKGVAVSAPFCVGIEHPSFRFVAHQTSGTWATMVVKVRWWNTNGIVNTTTVGAINGSDYAKWKATPTQMLATALPLTGVDQSLTAQIVFDPEDSGGAWAIDDLYIDPYRRS